LRGSGLHPSVVARERALKHDVKGTCCAAVGVGVMWYVARPGIQPFGPMPTIDVVRAIASGHIGPECSVGQAGADRWYPITAVPEFAAALQPKVPINPPRPARTPHWFGFSLLVPITILLGMDGWIWGREGLRLWWSLALCWLTLVLARRLPGVMPVLANRLPLGPRGAPFWAHRTLAVVCGVSILVAELFIVCIALYRAPVLAELHDSEPCVRGFSIERYGPPGSELRDMYDERASRCQMHREAEGERQQTALYTAACTTIAEGLKVGTLDEASLNVVRKRGPSGPADANTIGRLAQSALTVEDLKLTPDVMPCTNATWGRLVDRVATSPLPWSQVTRADEVARALRDDVVRRGADVTVKQAFHKQVEAVVANVLRTCSSASACSDGESMCALELVVAGGKRGPNCVAMKQRVNVLDARESAVAAREEKAERGPYKQCLESCARRRPPPEDIVLVATCLDVCGAEDLPCNAACQRKHGSTSSDRCAFDCVRKYPAASGM